MDPVSLTAALATFDDPWAPRTITTVNDYDVRVFKAHGEFVRHTHADTDELFLVLAGLLTIRLDEGDVTLGPGELYVVPRGTPHQPYSEDGASALLLEPSDTVNTGDNESSMTAPRRHLG